MIEWALDSCPHQARRQFREQRLPQRGKVPPFGRCLSICLSVKEWCMRAQPWGRARAEPASPSLLSCARTVPPTCGWERVPYIHKRCVQRVDDFGGTASSACHNLLRYVLDQGTMMIQNLFFSSFFPVCLSVRLVCIRGDKLRRG